MCALPQLYVKQTPPGKIFWIRTCPYILQMSMQEGQQDKEFQNLELCPSHLLICNKYVLSVSVWCSHISRTPLKTNIGIEMTIFYNRECVKSIKQHMTTTTWTQVRGKQFVILKIIKYRMILKHCRTTISLCI